MGNGDILTKDEDGKTWYYLRRRNMGHVKKHTHTDRVSAGQKLEDKDDKVMAVLDASDDSWVNEVKSLEMGGEAGPQAVQDHTLMKVQQAYDATNLCLREIKTCAMHLIGKVDNNTLNGAAGKCKVGNETLEHLEAILLNEKDHQMERDVRKALLASAKEYQTLKMKET